MLQDFGDERFRRDAAVVGHHERRGLDLERGECSTDRLQRRGSRLEDEWECEPLRVPAPEATLELVCLGMRDDRGNPQACLGGSGCCG